MNMRTKNQKQLLAPTWTCGTGILGAVLLLLGMAGWPACWAAESTAPAPASAALGQPLRVGITPDYPPLVFRQPDGTNGMEIDLAKELGAELKRPVQLVVLRWDELIPSLVEGQIDIIMSGMSITKARQLRIAFSEPYLHNELRAIFRLKDAAKFKTKDEVLSTSAKIAVIAGTTADVFVGKNCPTAQRVTIATRKDVAPLLIQGSRMDVYIDDTFALAQMISENEAVLAYLQEPLSEDDLAWGIRQNDRELLGAVNRALAKWKSDGTMEKVLDRWIPYLKNIKSKQSKP
jgi:ABC-type amino acid transport substrate-binding protein